MRRPIVALAAGLLAVSATVGCAAAPAAAARHPQLSRPGASPPEPIPPSALRQLPRGVFYLLAGPHLNDLNVWEASSAGVEEQLTHNAAGYEIDGMAASPKGVILADSLHQLDQLARWTSRGPDWLHPPGRPGQFVNGQAPDIRADGAITFLLPPHDGAGAMNSKDYSVWVRQSFAGPQKIVYRNRDFPGVSFLGPEGQVAVVGPVGQLSPSQHPAIVIISRAGAVRRIRTPFLDAHEAWGQHAPALVVSSLKGSALAFYQDGRRKELPAAWEPLAWNPAGTSLLMMTGKTLGTWSPRHPRGVAKIGAISRGFEILQASWLQKPAPL